MADERKKVTILDSLNPKNWGVPIFEESEFSEAFRKARNEGHKTFYWKNNRYHTGLIPKNYDNDLKKNIGWLENFYSNYTPTPTLDDTLAVNIDVLGKYHNKRDSLQNIIFSRLGPFSDNSEEEDKELKKAEAEISELPSKEKAERDSLLTSLPETIKNHYLNRIKQLKKSNVVVTTQPDKKYPTFGYFDPSKDKVYINLLSPTTDIHELEHFITTNRRMVPTNSTIYYKGVEDPYLLNHREISARALTIIKALEDEGYDPKTVTPEAYKKVVNKYFGNDKYLLRTFGDLELFNQNNPYK